MTKTLHPVSATGARHPARFTSRFHTDIYAPGDRTIVRAHGEIDRATRKAFRAALTTGLDRPRSLLIVDLAGVSALGGWGLAVLLGVANRAARAGIPITIVGARPRVYRRFALTHLIDRLDVHPTPTP
ncbi:anti-sigma B factor antagonist [Frankia sp. AiPs1]|uniref:STAS domain-containing protein n=1 Tax=Frankia sp. AiPa1 TaxID=573492 RepID=UPI00202AE643|nr:STAS domain-containing protein [Frankia sp. AiPa1]MCL9759650.1 STAS domain-containing protein [Frankia sp. AiPa1]